MGIGGVVEPGADLAALRAAIDACFETPLSCLGAQEVSDRLAALISITAKVDALRMEAVQAAEMVEVGRLSDQRNTANHIAQRTLAGPGSVRFDERIINWLAEFPMLARALRDGKITTAHVDKLRLKDNPRVHNLMVQSQRFFLRTFTTCQFRDLASILDEWLLGADPDGAEPNDQDPSIGLSLTRLPGGRVTVSGILDPLQGAALGDDVNAEANKLRAAEKESGAVSTVRRRTLDALLNLVGRGAAARLDGTFARPRVNIVMSQRVYEDTITLTSPTTVGEYPIGCEIFRWSPRTANAQTQYATHRSIGCTAITSPRIRTPKTRVCKTRDPCVRATTSGEATTRPAECGPTTTSATSTGATAKMATTAVPKRSPNMSSSFETDCEPRWRGQRDEFRSPGGRSNGRSPPWPVRHQERPQPDGDPKSDVPMMLPRRRTPCPQ